MTIKADNYPLSIFRDLLAVLALMVGSAVAHASLPVNTYADTGPTPVIAEFDYHEDFTAEEDFQNIASLPDDRWQRASGGSGSFGFSDSAYWLRLALNNSATGTRNLVLEIAYPLLDDVTFYALYPDGTTDRVRFGDTYTFSFREIDHPGMLFRLQLRGGETVQLYARVKTEGSMILPVRLWWEKDFFEFAGREQTVHFFYYGALSVIILINLAVFFTLREKLYLFYALATFGYLLFFLTSRGYALQLIFPDSPSLNSQAFLSSMPILALFSLLFAREFLKTAQHSPKMDWCLRAMIWFEYFNMVAAVVFDYNTAVKISAASSFFLFAVLFIAGPVTWAAKRRAGIFFTVAWLPLTLGFAATGGRTSGLLPNNFWTEYAMQIGSGLEAFILTLALADRLYREREKKIQAQADSLQKEKQRNKAQSELAKAMTRDAVTDLPNRNRFEWLITKTLLENPEGRFIVGVARITRINEITRTLGLASSERVLRTIALQMNQEASGIPGIITGQGSEDFSEATFQLSGDTFGVLINQHVSQDHIELYQQILKKLYSPIIMDSLTIELDPRFGCALYPAHGHDAAQLIRNAHVAMEASTQRSDHIGFYDQSLDIYNESRLTLMSDLRDALRSDTPTLHYQPKLDLDSDRITGLEALIRWHHPQRGNVPPSEFIPLAEETGVIHELTGWAFRKAVKALAMLTQQGYTGTMSVNISARDLLNSELTESFEVVTSEYGVPPEKIVLELTETAAMEDPEAGLAALTRITEAGFKVAIDDFGVGYSSLSYLKSLPTSEIKLDRSLVKDLCRDENTRIIVQTAIDMSHNLGYKVVAEGVENEGTYLFLKQVGCDRMQGFWLCRPISLDELQFWLQERERA